MRRITGVLIALALLLMLPTAAQAAFPGQNGKIAFSRFRGGTDLDIYTVNRDGTGETPLTSGPATDRDSAWSPDGSKIAFTSNRDASTTEVYVMNADGSAVTRITNNAVDDYSPAWSPDGTKLAYVHQVAASRWGIFVSNSDGSGETPIFDAGESSFVEPAWSPDGSKIAFAYNDNPDFHESSIATVSPDGTGFANVCCAVQSHIISLDWSPDGQQITFSRDGLPKTGVWIVNRDGTGLHVVPGTPTYGDYPVWSPDGTKIAFKKISNPSPPFAQIYSVNPDGTGAIPLTPGSEASLDPDWQPILKGYARPKGAGTLYVPLVPAYQECTTPNRRHAAPLSFGSCNPPTQTSTQLTIGTPDANLNPAASVASLRIGVIPGTAGPPDDAEVNLITSITDVRNASDLFDYTGNVEMRVPLRITDKSNTPYPGGPGPGTAQDLTLTWNVPCTATSDPNIGSDCSLFTTAHSLLPGIVLEGRRAIWQTDQIEVRDGDGDPFMRQGVFVP